MCMMYIVINVCITLILLSFYHLFTKRFLSIFARERDLKTIQMVNQALSDAKKELELKVERTVSGKINNSNFRC
jgi:hypothetical protein